MTKTPTVETPAENAHFYLLSVLSQTGELLTALTECVEQGGGLVKKSEDLGLRKLAYPINRHLELHLLSVFFETDGEKARKIEQEVTHEDGVERLLLTRWNAPLEQSERINRSRFKDSANRRTEAHV